MLLVANLANTELSKNLKKLLKPWHMGTYLRVLSESYPMNTNMTEFRRFSNTVEHIYDACPKYSELGSFRIIAYLYVSDGSRS